MENLAVSFKFTPDSPWLAHGNEIWDKIDYNSASARDICKIFASLGGFLGWDIECCQWNFAPTLPGCHGNKIKNKMGYNSVFTKDVCEIFASIGRFSRLGYRIGLLPTKFCPDRSLLPWQRNLRQKDYNSDSVIDISKIFASNGRFQGTDYWMRPI